MFAQLLQFPPHAVATEQIANQRLLLERLEPMRLVSSAVAFGLMTLFLPPILTLSAMAADLGFEKLGLWLMQKDDMTSLLRRQRLIMASVALMEISYATPCLLIWQQDLHFAKALAVGLLCMTLFQLSTVRAIHLPFGLSGWAALVTVAVIGNAVYWVNLADWTGLLFSTMGTLAAAFFALGAMKSNHDLHVEISKRVLEADSANRAKGRFLAQMSHELRTPLNAILGMGEAELALTPDSGSKARMRTLVGSARDLAVILDDILEISALGEQGLPIRPVVAEPEQIIAATVNLFRPVFTASGLSLDLQLTAALPAAARLDPQRLRQCLSNLLSNALKFTQRGGVSVWADLSDDGLLQVDIQDSGRGIAQHETDLVFQPFQRGAGEQSGTGLGLSISRGLARQMGGDLILVPCPQGARFRLTLSFEPVEAVAEIAAPNALDLTGFRFLVVDDIATNRLVAATYLRLIGAEAVEASTGKEALESIRHSRPDAVLLDMNMPGMSGLETLAHIRAQPGESLPVIAMTADASSAFRRHYMNAGLDGYLAKPLTPEAVSAVLATVLPLSRRMERAAGPMA